jgi:hypothetical protein
VSKNIEMVIEQTRSPLHSKWNEKGTLENHAHQVHFQNKLETKKEL